MKATAEERRILTNPDSRGRDAMTISRPQDRQKARAVRRPRFDPWLVVMAVGFALAIAAIAYPAALMDIHFVHEAMEDAQVRAFLEKIEADEIIPAVPPVPGTDLQAYFAKVAERCANPKIGDTVRRLCLDGSNRQPKFIVPTIAHRLERGLPVDGLALESALWCRYCAGTSDSGAVIEPNDPNWDRLVQVAQAARTDPSAWLDMAEIYGETGRDPRLAEPFARWLAMLWQKGTRATLDAYLKG